MTPRQIAEMLVQQLGQAIIASNPDDKHPRVHLNACDWRKVAEYLYHDAQLRFDWLACLSAVDYPTEGKLCGVYDLRSTVHNHLFAVKVYCDRTNPHIPTVCDLWPGANWHEREAYDLLGIIFDGHPDLRRK